MSTQNFPILRRYLGLVTNPSGLLQIVTTTPAISGDFPENSEHGVPDSVGQSWDVIWCQPFCGHWGQHPDLTSPWEGVSTIRAVCWDSAHRCSLLSELSCCLLPSSTFQFPSLCHGNCHVLSEAFPNPSPDTSMPCQPSLSSVYRRML